MDCVQFFVYRRGAGWVVSLAGEEYGPYPTEQAGVARAVGSAELCVDEGAAARVVLEGRLGGFRTVWAGDPEARATAIAA